MHEKSQVIDTKRMTVIALMMSLTVIATIIIRIPVPLTQGYINLGDAIIFFGALTMRKKDAAVSAGLGSAIGDVIGGYAFWAPWTLVIKGAMALTAGLIIERAYLAGDSQRKRSFAVVIAGMAAGGMVMSLGYLVAERILYGSWSVAIVEFPWNILQFGVGIPIALALHAALGRFVQQQ